MSIYKKLLKFQEEVGAVAKDSLNPHFKSKYFDINNVLEEIKPILTKYGLVVTQPLKEDAVFSVITDVETGEDIQSFLHFDPSEKNPQKIGSIITYYRRYTLCSLLGIAGEDDDAEQAKTPTPTPTPKPVQKPIPKDFDGLLNAIANPDLKEYNKEWALKEYTLSPAQIELINKLELIKK